jgi:hypothetical protein
LRIPHFLANQLTDGGEVVSLMHKPHFTFPERFLINMTVTSSENPSAIVWLEGLGTLKKSSDLIRMYVENLHNFKHCYFIHILFLTCKHLQTAAAIID